MQGEKHAIFSIGDFLGKEFTQGFLAHEGAVDDFTILHGDVACQRYLAFGVFKLDLE